MSVALTVSTTIINESEFPSLVNRGTPGAFPNLPTTSAYSSSNHQSPVPPGYVQNNRPNYANLMRSGSEGLGNSGEFHIQSEDFPALPGATSSSKVASAFVGGIGPLQASDSATHAQTVMQLTTEMVNSTTEGRYVEQQRERDEGSIRTGIITHPDGEVSNIPPGMLNDQYGMAGLVTYLRAVDNPAIVALALGHDLTTLGLNLNAPDRMLYSTFGGPWADYPCRTQDMDAKVPVEYLTNATIRDKLPNIKLQKLGEDVLFYLFYNCPGEVYQVAAAVELYSRDWRFHKGECVWLTRSQYGGVKEQTGSYEKGSYNVFDPIQWRKIPKDMTLEYKQECSVVFLTDCPWLWTATATLVLVALQMYNKCYLELSLARYRCVNI
ncbi:unnamed protein product, partial [Mesorhabditis belari]|uniref:NOT2/NOT3/NOT5 C-terminal domain-containing protein n=1 Tax=Mesorhabditis belari TaxID=2138241 RepID=A0AAF3EYG6_9BILA